MDNEVFLLISQLDSDNLRLLILQDELHEDECTVDMSLSPFLCINVIHLEAQRRLPQLVHDVDPRDGLQLILLESEQSENFWQQF